MARDLTALATFKRIEAEGLLVGNQMAVYAALFHHGPKTAAELAEIHKISGGWKRLSELKRRGCVAEVGFKKCLVTGSHALVWDVTADLPGPLVENEETPREKIRRLERTVRRQDWKLTVFRQMLRDMFALANDKGKASAIILKGKIEIEKEGVDSGL